MPTLDITKRVQTRNGCKARIHATDGAEPYTILGAILDDRGWIAESWTATGSYCVSEGGNPESDLVNAPVRHKQGNSPVVASKPDDRDALIAMLRKALNNTMKLIDIGALIRNPHVDFKSDWEINGRGFSALQNSDIALSITPVDATVQIRREVLEEAAKAVEKWGGMSIHMREAADELRGMKDNPHA